VATAGHAFIKQFQGPVFVRLDAWDAVLVGRRNSPAGWESIFLEEDGPWTSLTKASQEGLLRNRLNT
jgi:hypothetical protein